MKDRGVDAVGVGAGDEEIAAAVVGVEEAEGITATMTANDQVPNNSSSNAVVTEVAVVMV